MKMVEFDQLDWGRFQYRPQEEIEVVKEVMKAVREADTR